MNTKLAALALLTTGLLAGCSGDSVNPVIPEPTDPGGNGPLPPLQGSSHYLGPYYSTDLPGIGSVEINYTGCDGLRVIASSRCMNLRLDGADSVVDTIEAGSIVEFALGTSEPPDAFIDVQHAVAGPVQSVEPTHARFTVLGQTVHVTSVTAGFGSAAQAGVTSLNDLLVGDWVTVSGYFSASGEVLATLVEQNVEAGPLLLRGVLASTADGALRIGGMTVDLGTASLENFPGGSPLAGDTVLLFADQVPEDDVLIVQTARYATNTFKLAEASSIEGFVTDVRSNWDFDIGGRTVQTYDCEDCKDLDRAGTLLRKGTFVEFGTTVTGYNYFGPARSTGGIGLAGPVDAVDPANGSLSILGISVQTSPATLLATEVNPWLGSGTFALSDLTLGSTVTVQGGVLDGQVIASNLALAGSGARIDGSILYFDLEEPFVRFLGLNIETDVSTTVLDCGLMGDGCVASDITWLFTSAQLGGMLVEIEMIGSELRAISIEAYSSIRY